MKLKPPKTAESYIPTASMADIAFLLIVFFMVTTTISVDRTTVQLPTSMERGETPLSGRQAGSYNFVATREWMLLVPRAEEFFDGTSVNSLGFAGALLVRSREEVERLKARGPMTVLRSVAVPRPSSGEGRRP